MSESVYILGGGRTDFKRNLKKEGKTIRHIIIEAGKKAIDDAKIDPGEIQAGAVGNFNAGQFTKQLQLGRLSRRSIRNCVAFHYAHRSGLRIWSTIGVVRRGIDHGRLL